MLPQPPIVTMQPPLHVLKHGNEKILRQLFPSPPLQLGRRACKRKQQQHHTIIRWSSPSPPVCGESSTTRSWFHRHESPNFSSFAAHAERIATSVALLVTTVVLGGRTGASRASPHRLGRFVRLYQSDYNNNAERHRWKQNTACVTRETLILLNPFPSGCAAHQGRTLPWRYRGVCRAVVEALYFSIVSLLTVIRLLCCTGSLCSEESFSLTCMKHGTGGNEEQRQVRQCACVCLLTYGLVEVFLLNAWVKMQCTGTAHSALSWAIKGRLLIYWKSLRVYEKCTALGG